MYLINGIFCILLITIYCNANESPGFFLKVSKNIPRIGRRANSLSDFENFFLKASKSVPRIGRRDSFVDPDLPDEMVQQWYDLMMNPSKRFAAQPQSLKLSNYNKVQPLDSKFLMNVLSSDTIDPEDFKFVSWKDFDTALESDEGLYRKLIELAIEHNEIEPFKDKLNIDQFIGMSGNHRLNGGNDLFYRVDRAAQITDHTDLNKESVKYQM